MPVFMYHRYAVEASASMLGGQDFIYAMRGDGPPRDFRRTQLAAACSRFGQSMTALGKTLPARTA